MLNITYENGLSMGGVIDEYSTNATTKDYRICGGVICVTGKRVTISNIIASLRDGMTLEDICEQYNLTNDGLINALNDVVDIFNTL